MDEVCLMNFSYWLADTPNLADYASLPRPGVDAIEFAPLPIAVVVVPPAGEHFGVGRGPVQLHATELVAIVVRTPEPNAVEPVAMVGHGFEAQALRFVERRQRDVGQCVALEQQQRGDGLEQRPLDAMRRSEII